MFLWSGAVSTGVDNGVLPDQVQQIRGFQNRNAVRARSGFASGKRHSSPTLFHHILCIPLPLAYPSSHCSLLCAHMCVWRHGCEAGGFWRVLVPVLVLFPSPTCMRAHPLPIRLIPFPQSLTLALPSPAFGNCGRVSWIPRPPLLAHRPPSRQSIGKSFWERHPLRCQIRACPSLPIDSSSGPDPIPQSPPSVPAPKSKSSPPIQTGTAGKDEKAWGPSSFADTRDVRVRSGHLEQAGAAGRRAESPPLTRSRRPPRRRGRGRRRRRRRPRASLPGAIRRSAPRPSILPFPPKTHNYHSPLPTTKWESGAGV